MLRGLVPYLAYGYMSLVGWTTRLQRRGEEHLRAARAQGPCLWAFWHQRQVFFTWSHRGERCAVLVSKSQDGELIARTMELSGIASCRGSSSRGAAAGAREMIETVKRGFDVGITPDGPKGPCRRVKPGVIELARSLGIPILPISNALSRKLVFERSWDRFQVPLPFGRAVVRYGKPITVGPDDDFDAKASELRRALDAITDEAQNELGITE